ncbi:MAG: DUF4367 domain-containing protein [Lachnospiraceae bacterium]|nr:DUF4367 domain-containing protein [Lachnospiraceae bacterium]
MIITDEMLYENAEKACILYLDELSSECDAAPEHIFSNKFNRHMRKMIRQQRRSPQMQKFVKFCSRAAIVVIIILAGLLITTLSVEAYRAKFINFFRKITGQSDDYRYWGGTDKLVDVDLPKTIIGYIPEGFEKAEEDISLIEFQYYVRYKNSLGHAFNIRLSKIDENVNGILSLDNERSESDDVLINGNSGVLYKMDSANCLIWTNYNILCDIYGEISLDELMKIAENIEFSYDVINQEK